MELICKDQLILIVNGGEAFSQTMKRAKEVLKPIETNYSSGYVLVVKHSVVIECLFAIFKNAGIENLRDPPYIEDTSLTIVEKRNAAYQLILEGCTVHKTNH